MENSTPIDCKPSELTLHILREIAHSYPSSSMSEEQQRLCLN